MSQRPKNILFLWTDQQRPDTIGAYGNRQIQTPHLDRLAASGTLFEQAYCTQPVCSPSRASVLTGLYPHSHGVVTNSTPLPADLPTLAELLRPAGYACGYVGKWHLGNELGAVPPGRRGFDELWVSTEDGDVDHRPKGQPNTSYFDFLLGRGYEPEPDGRGGRIFSRIQAARLPEEVGKPAFQAGECLRFLEQFRDRPFVLMCNFLEPHSPNFGPFDGMYDPADMTLPESWYSEMEETVPLRYRVLRQYYADSARWRRIAYGQVDPGKEDVWKETKARYWGLCSLVDKYVGRILTRLEELGLAEDTVVVYTSDHGNMLGEHRLQNKSVQYEGAARVPLIMRSPGAQPRRIATPVSLVHIVPTLLDLLDRPVPEHVQGETLTPLIARGDSAADEAEVVVEWQGPIPMGKAARSRPDGVLAAAKSADGAEDPAARRKLEVTEVRTIRRARWKLNVHLSGEHELYDLEHDPGERHNAIHDPGREGVVADLYARLLAWQRRTDDRLDLPDPTSAGTAAIPAQTN